MIKRNITRRQFLTTTVAVGAGSVLLGKSALRLPSGVPVLSSDPLQIVTLGKSGIKTTLLGMGTGFSGYNRSSNITGPGLQNQLSMRHMKKEFVFSIVLIATGLTHTLLQPLKTIQGNHIP